MGHAFDNNFSFFFTTWEWHGPPSLVVASTGS